MIHRHGISRADMIVAVVCVLWVVWCAGAVGGHGVEVAKRVVCLANMERLTQAWRMCAQDNDGSIPSAEPGRGVRPWIQSRGAGLHDAVVIEGGSLWSYCQDYSLYRCPNGIRGETVTYSIVCSMGGNPPPGTPVTKLSEIPESAASSRMVFIDVGRMTPDSFTVYHDKLAWWDPAPVRHDNGTCVSFVDGHSEYWQWGNPIDDIVRLQKAVWAK